MRPTRLARIVVAIVVSSATIAHSQEAVDLGIVDQIEEVRLLHGRR